MMGVESVDVVEEEPDEARARARSGLLHLTPRDCLFLFLQPRDMTPAAEKLKNWKM